MDPLWGPDWIKKRNERKLCAIEQNKTLFCKYVKIAVSASAGMPAADIYLRLTDAAADVCLFEPAVSPRPERQRLPSKHASFNEDLPPFDELSTVGLMGCGSFGRVELVHHERSGRSFARKCLSKGHILKKGAQRAVWNERLVMALVRSPFVMFFFGSYNREQHIVYLLEPLLGGDLYGVYRKMGFYGSEVHGRYYIACLCLALQYLHGCRIVYRGVKMEDCVLDREGRMKLCDLGFAKPVVEVTYTICGTPEYYAPEMIADYFHGPNALGYGFNVDWWGAGVLMFELLVGRTPFVSETPMQIYSNVQAGIEKVAFPESATCAEDLIKALLRQEPQERLPVQPGGVANLKNHDWFAKFDWVGLENETLQPPYVPEVRNSTDLSNFPPPHPEDIPKDVPYHYGESSWDHEYCGDPEILAVANGRTPDEFKALDPPLVRPSEDAQMPFKNALNDQQDNEVLVHTRTVDLMGDLRDQGPLTGASIATICCLACCFWIPVIFFMGAENVLDACPSASFKVWLQMYGCLPIAVSLLMLWPIAIFIRIGNRTLFRCGMRMQVLLPMCSTAVIVWGWKAWAGTEQHECVKVDPSVDPQSLALTFLIMGSICIPCVMLISLMRAMNPNPEIELHVTEGGTCYGKKLRASE